MHSGTVGPRQSVKAQRLLISTIHLHTFYVVQKFAAVQYLNGATKAECLGRYSICGNVIGSTMGSLLIPHRLLWQTSMMYCLKTCAWTLLADRKIWFRPIIRVSISASRAK